MEKKAVLKKIVFLYGILVLIMMSGCLDPNQDEPVLTATFTVAYAGSGEETGTIPDQDFDFKSGEPVPVLTPEVEREGYLFTGWNTAENGSGTAYVPGSTFLMPEDHLKLYAQWAPFSFAVVSVPEGGIVFPMGENDDRTAEIENSFEVGRTEVLWALWYPVMLWAVDPAIDHDGDGEIGDDVYVFGNTGQMGSKSNGSGMNNLHPVTHVSWRDAVVFCNALTEYSNAVRQTSLLCIYYQDPDFGEPLRVSTVDYSVDMKSGSQDNPYVYAPGFDSVNSGDGHSFGYRLLSKKEWELSSRWAGGSGAQDHLVSNESFPDLTPGYFWTPGNAASGSTVKTNNAEDKDGNGVFDGREANDNVAVYDLYWNGSSWESAGIIGTSQAGSLQENGLGLFDMSGNVMEWCFDWYLSGSYRSAKGGSWNSFASALQTGKRNPFDPYSEHDTLGFRIGRTE